MHCASIRIYMKHIIPLLQFTLILAGYTLLIYGAGLWIQSLSPIDILSPLFPQILIVLFIVTFFAHTTATIGIAGKPEAGVFGILGAVVIKMILSLSFFIFLIYRFPDENTTLLGLNFFCIYLLLTGFEVSVLLRNLRRKIN